MRGIFRCVMVSLQTGYQGKLVYPKDLPYYPYFFSIYQRFVKNMTSTIKLFAHLFSIVNNPNISAKELNTDFRMGMEVKNVFHSSLE